MSVPKPSKNKLQVKASAADELVSKHPVVMESSHDAGKTQHRPANDADEEKAAQLGIRTAAPIGVPAPARHANLRRSSHALQLLGLLFVIMLLLFGALLVGINSFYEQKIQPFLGGSQSSAQPAAIPAAVKIDIPAETRSEIAAATAGIAELQKQIDAMRDSSSTIESRLRELSDRVSAAATVPALGPSRPIDIAPTLATDGKPESEVAAIVPVTSSTNKELVLLKERNRLTAWADEAIATGNRKSLGNLINRLTDPDFANLRDATFAEIQRIYYHLRFTIRIDPNFRIPVNEMFKDSGIRDESDLTTEQLVKLLHDYEQAWQVRLRSAWLLGGRRTLEVSEALIKSVKEDPVLDVAKEAQLSLEQNNDRKFLLLDVPAIDEWWKSQKDVKKDAPPLPEAGKPDVKNDPLPLPVADKPDDAKKPEPEKSADVKKPEPEKPKAKSDSGASTKKKAK